MKHLETKQGIGNVVSQTGKTRVEYRLEVYQRQVPCGSLSDPRATIPGLKQIEGVIAPFSGALGEMLTLEMSDGCRVRFFFRDRSGSVVVSGGIEMPEAANAM